MPACPKISSAAGDAINSVIVVNIRMLKNVKTFFDRDSLKTRLKYII